MIKTLWLQCLLLEKELRRRGEEISRIKIQEAFSVPQALAQNIVFALKNRDLIQIKPEAFEGVGKRVLVIADLHIPFSDKLCVETVLEYADEYKPDIIVILGDLVDFYKISKYVKNPLKKSVSGELQEGGGFLVDLRNRYRNSEIIYKQGNHEDRMTRYIMENAKEIYDLVSDLLPQKLRLNELKIKYIVEPFRIGRLWLLHGHEKVGGSYNPEYITNVMWKYIHDHFLVGHYHRNQEKIFKNIEGKQFWGAAVGYLAGELDWAILHNWTHGFATIDFDNRGNFRGRVRTVQGGEIF